MLVLPQCCQLNFTCQNESHVAAEDEIATAVSDLPLDIHLQVLVPLAWPWPGGCGGQQPEGQTASQQPTEKTTDKQSKCTSPNRMCTRLLLHIPLERGGEGAYSKHPCTAMQEVRGRWTGLQEGTSWCNLLRRQGRCIASVAIAV